MAPTNVWGRNDLKIICSHPSMFVLCCIRYYKQPINDSKYNTEIALGVCQTFAILQQGHDYPWHYDTCQWSLGHSSGCQGNTIFSHFSETEDNLLSKVQSPEDEGKVYLEAKWAGRDSVPSLPFILMLFC